MLLERRDIRGGSYAEAPSLQPQASLGEVFSASIDEARYSWNVDANLAAYEEAYDRRLDAVFAATGQRHDNPFRVGSAFAARNPGFAESKGGGSVDPHAAFQSWLERLADEQPDHRDVIAPDRPVLHDALDLQRRAVAGAGDTYARAGTGAFLASLGGAFVGSLSDPVNLATLALGPWNAVGQGVRAVLWNGAKVGAINAGAEVASYPWVRDWRAKAGLEYSLGELAQHAGAAFLFGAAVDAGGRSLYRGVSGLRGEPMPAPPQGAAADRALDDAAAALPADNAVRRASEGDLAALRETVTATGQADDPAVRGALQAADLEDGLEVSAPLVDAGDGLSRLAQAIRSSIDETEPPPGHADPVPPQRSPDLSNEAPLPKGEPGANQYARRFPVDGKAVTFREVDPATIVADPATFQFKGGGDTVGATARLSGVETWDPVAAGRAIVFESKAGALVIADGHQRLALAKRLLAGAPEGEISLPAFVFREADGWTPGDVRALAAKKNLQEGSGTTIDAAKIIRERPDIIDASVPLSSEAMRQSRSLARLSDEAFGKVVAGVVPPNHAAMIGDLVPDKALHSGMVDELVAADPANAREARFIVSELMHAPIQHQVQLTLLGAETMARPLLRERAKVLDAALRLLREDKQIFGLLEREAGRIERAGNALRRDANASAALEAETVSAVIEQLAANRGPVSDWLTDAARDIAGDAPVRKAAETFAKRVRDALQKDGLAGLAAAPPEPLRAGGFADVTGPEAKAQVEALQAQFGGEGQASLFALDQASEPASAIRAFHGTPHDFGRFDSAHIGEGAGQQLYGRGLYFAERSDVADGHRGAAGRLYEVRIHIEPNQLLSWNEPLRGQSAGILKLAAEHEAELIARFGGNSGSYLDDLAGEELFHVLSDLVGSPEAAMTKVGVPGVRYLDGPRLPDDAATHNIVVFPGNEHLIETVSKDGVPLLQTELDAVKREGAIGVIVEGCQL